MLDIIINLFYTICWLVIGLSGYIIYRSFSNNDSPIWIILSGPLSYIYILFQWANKDNLLLYTIIMGFEKLIKHVNKFSDFAIDLYNAKVINGNKIIVPRTSLILASFPTLIKTSTDLSKFLFGTNKELLTTNGESYSSEDISHNLIQCMVNLPHDVDVSSIVTDDDYEKVHNFLQTHSNRCIKVFNIPENFLKGVFDNVPTIKVNGVIN